MKNWNFYNPLTGVFSGRVFSGGGEHLEANTPGGHAAIEGHFDHLSQRVDIATGQVVDYQPPAPPDDELRTWSWDVLSKRWRSTSTLAAIAADVRAKRDALFERSDREMIKAVRLGLPPSPEWAAYAQALADVPEQAGFPTTVEWPTIPS